MKKIIYFITLLFLVGCVDLSENMYNDLGKDNYYQTEQEYDAAFMNQPPQRAPAPPQKQPPCHAYSHAG